MQEVGKLKLSPLIIIHNGDIFILQSNRNRKKRNWPLACIESPCKPLFPTKWEESDGEKAANESERNREIQHKKLSILLLSRFIYTMLTLCSDTTLKPSY